MKSYKLNHKNFSFKVDFKHPLLAYKEKLSYLICKTNLDNLYARVVIDAVLATKVKHKIVKLRETPHFRYINNDKNSYLAYLEKYGENVGYGIEHSVENFEKLLSDKHAYLEGKFSSNYIICEKYKTSFWGYKNIIIDGVHRACLLLKQGFKEVPVAFIDVKPPKSGAQLDRYLKDYKDDFLEWYTPVEIAGKVIHERTYPDFRERVEYLTNKERGKSKWDFIIKKNLPSLKGKTVCDIGCNVGLFSIFMAQMGAKKVDGFDRDECVIQPTNKNLPMQNVVQQAYFVKNLFKLAWGGNINRVNYFKCDINTLDFSKLKYDFMFASCVLYHFGEKKFEEIIRKVSVNISEIFLQTNLGHGKGRLAKLASIAYQKNLLEKYGYQVKVDAPEGYNYPILYGRKKI